MKLHDSADNVAVESFQTNERHVYQGRREAAVKAASVGGKIIVTATAPGLSEAKVEIETKPSY